MSLLAHGGVAGAVVELVLVLGVVAVFVAVWVRERGASSDDEGDS